MDSCPIQRRPESQAAEAMKSLLFSMGEPLPRAGPPVWSQDSVTPRVRTHRLATWPARAGLARATHGALAPDLSSWAPEQQSEPTLRLAWRPAQARDPAYAARLDQPRPAQIPLPAQLQAAGAAPYPPDWRKEVVWRRTKMRAGLRRTRAHLAPEHLFPPLRPAPGATPSPA